MALTRWILISLFALCAGGLAAQSTFTVTSTADTTASGTLRWAITQANSSTSTFDTIDFGITGTITLNSALPAITDDVLLDGPGRSALTIIRNSGGPDFRIFETTVNGTTLNINELTISGGRASQGAGIFSRGPTSLYDVHITDCIANGTTGGGNAEGGAIYHSPIAAALLLTNSLVDNCQASGGDNSGGKGGNASGGGIYLNTGTLGLFSTTIDNCDVTGGDSTGGNGSGGDASGGGVYSNYAATFTDSVVSNCSATGGAPTGTGSTGLSEGAGIFGTGAVTSLDTSWSNNAVNTRGNGGGAIFFAPSSGQQLTVTRSIFTGNSLTTSLGNTDAPGSAIYAQGIVEIRETEFSANIATPAGTGDGSTIEHDDSATFLMERSTVAGNTGNGLRIGGSSSASIVNSTISGNTSSALAGGITCTGSILSVTFCTITLNTGATGGGIATDGSGTITVVGSIIADNTGGAAADADYAVSGGTIADGGGNVIGVEDGAVFTNMTTQAGTSGTPLDAMLSALADNGGLTRTHALMSGSPAIDNGGSTGAPSTDQRNAPRTGGSADAGAYEFGATVPSGQGNAGGEGDSRCTVTATGGNIWLLLLALIGAAGVAVLTRRTA